MSDQPAGYWRLGEPPGTTVVADSSGFGHDGTASPGVTFGEPGTIADGGTAAAFDGASGAVVIPYNEAFDLGAFSWEAWMKVAGEASVRRDILSRGATESVFALWIDANATEPTFDFLPSGGGRQTVTLSFTYDVAVDICPNCYDCVTAATHAHFFEPLHWSEFAEKRMKIVLPPAIKTP